MIKLMDVYKTYDNGTKALNGIDLEVDDGEFVFIVGPSGSGKSTITKLLIGEFRPSSGKVLVNNFDLTTIKNRQLPYMRRTVGVVFQDFRLIEKKTVFENVAFVMRAVGTPPRIIKKRVPYVLDLVGVLHKARRHPDELSGGEQQRVAIARALANHPQVLLLDEPLGALDLKLRKEMQLELKNIQRELGITFIYVTHDQEEALTMSDTIVVMNKGIIQQVGTPIGIYNEPVNAFVADFIGESNIVPGVIHKDFLCSFGGKRFECTDQGFGKDESVDVVIRPEDFKIVPPEEDIICGTVESLVFKGVHYEMLVESKDGTEWLVHSTLPEAVGTHVGLKVAPFDIHIMKKSTREDQTPVDADPEATDGGAEE